jgi:rhodanese-related sulfurtransferase
MAAPEEISPVEAHRLLSDQPQQTVLLDVREPMELELARVDGALHIPMGAIPARLNEIDRAKLIICLCRSGGRSAQVAAFLRQQGFSDARNLIGGINAWSTDVDNSIQPY